jgi:hypothetical protein
MSENKPCDVDVQIIRNDLVKRYARDKWPTLWKEVMELDSISTSSWYLLTPEAYEEFRSFSRKYPA